MRVLVSPAVLADLSVDARRVADRLASTLAVPTSVPGRDGSSADAYAFHQQRWTTRRPRCSPPSAS